MFLNLNTGDYYLNYEGEEWWNSAERTGDESLLHSYDQALVIRRKGNRKRDRTVLENGDFVEIFTLMTRSFGSRGGPEGYEWVQKQYPWGVMRMVFEMIKTKPWDGKSESEPITNMWNDEPVLPVFQI